MPRRRARPRARRRQNNTVVNHDFFGWQSTDSGYEVRILASKISLPADRPMRPVYLRVQLDSVATTSTYMIPSNSPVLSASIISATGSVVSFTRPVLIPHGSKTSVFLRAPRSIDFSQYGSNSTVAFLHFSQPAAGTTISYCGTIGMQYARHQLARGVKLEDHIEELNSRMECFSVEHVE